MSAGKFSGTTISGPYMLSIQKHNRLMQGRGILQGSQCQACLRHFGTNVRLCRHLRFNPACRLRLVQSGFLCSPEPGVGSRKEETGGHLQAPVMQAQGPLLQMPLLDIHEERQRPIAEILDCLSHLDFDGTVGCASDEELWRRIRDSFSCVCASTDRLRVTVETWNGLLSGYPSPARERLEVCADWLRQADLVEWLVPDPKSAQQPVYTFKDSLDSLAMLDVSQVRLPSQPSAHNCTVIVVAPGSWGHRADATFWKSALLFSHEECLEGLREGHLPSFFDGPFQDVCFILVACGLPSRADRWPSHLNEQRFQSALTAACFQGDLLRFFIRLSGLGVPSAFVAATCGIGLQAVSSMPQVRTGHGHDCRVISCQRDLEGLVFHHFLN